MGVSKGQIATRSLRNSRGMTLIELMVGLVIISIGLSVAVPSFQGMIQRNSVATQVNEMLLAINLARGEAGRSGVGANVQAITPTSDDEFGGGFCVYRIPTFAEDNAYSPSAADCNDANRVIRKFPALTNNATLNLVNDNGDTFIEFSALGGVKDEISVSIDFCMSGQLGRRIFISPIGRAKSHRGTDPIAARQPNC